MSVRPIPFADRMEKYVERIPFHSCWEWTGYLTTEGYGLTSINGRNELAHRATFIMFVGHIADGLELDHLCRNRSCVNPAHLEAVTPAENRRRGTGPTAINGRKSHCSNGHPFDAANTYHRKGIEPSRVCRKCERDRTRAYRLRQKHRDEAEPIMQTRGPK